MLVQLGDGGRDDSRIVFAVDALVTGAFEIPLDRIVSRFFRLRQTVAPVAAVDPITDQTVSRRVRRLNQRLVGVGQRKVFLSCHHDRGRRAFDDADRLRHDDGIALSPDRFDCGFGGIYADVDRGCIQLRAGFVVICDRTDADQVFIGEGCGPHIGLLFAGNCGDRLAVVRFRIGCAGLAVCLQLYGFQLRFVAKGVAA